MDEEAYNPTWRPLTPEELKALKQAYVDLPSISITYDKPAEQQPKLPARELLRLFEERRKVNPRVRLKPFCDEMGANFNSIRAAKARIDKEKRKHKKKRVNS